ncbi:MAG: putative signal transducing protein [Thiotrichales bacterium]
MKHLLTHHDPIFVGYLQANLESEQIPCHIKNGFLTGALGELPPTATWPELWVIHDEDFAQASALIEGLLPPTP